MTDFSIRLSHCGVVTITADHFIISNDFVVFYIVWCEAVVKIASFDREDIATIRYKRKIVDVQSSDSVGSYFP